MKIQLETILPDSNSSFQLLLHSRLNDFYYWHYHPEIELNYIEGANGQRHIGEHMSPYRGSNLVLIGSNIPHLNNDYGIKTDYQKTVLHIHPKFLDKALEHTPELTAIHQLFEKTRFGISFEGDTKAKAGEMIKKMPALSTFEQFIQVLRILELLAGSTEIILLHDKPVKNQHNKKLQERLQRLHRFIEENYHRRISLEEVTDLCHMTKVAFCRYFKQTTHLTFTEFLNYYRINQAKRLLLLDKSISEIGFECGFESQSYFNKVFKKIVKETPLGFRKKYMNHQEATIG